MLHKAWSSIEEVPYCFPSSSVKFQGHTALKITEFDPNWAFPDCNCSLNSPMAMKWCTKLEVAQKMCPIVFQGHTSNCKVTRLKKIVDFDTNWAFPGCNSILNSLMDCKWCTKLDVIKKRCPIIFGVIHWIWGHTGWKIDVSNPIWVRLLGRSQLSNPSDLPCFRVCYNQLVNFSVIADICITVE